MPIYKYVCGDCSLKFEEIVDFNKSNDVNCPACKSGAQRQFPDSISVKSTLDPKRDTIVSPKEIDQVVGADADKKRQVIEDRVKNKTRPKFGFDEKYHEQYSARQAKRRNGLEPKEIAIPKDADGKYTPIMHLGDEREKKIRGEFVEALGEHRANRKAQGLSQFDDSGSVE